MQITISKSFVTRQDLDDYIRTTFGDDVQVNKTVTFQSTAENLKALNLSESSTVWGVKVKTLPVDEIVSEVIAPTPMLGSLLPRPKKSTKSKLKSKSK